MENENYKKRIEFKRYTANSKNWKKLKKERLAKDNNSCILCKTKDKKLLIHHITYKNLYHEEINDVVTLCISCHNKIHKVSPPKDIPFFIGHNDYECILKDEGKIK